MNESAPRSSAARVVGTIVEGSLGVIGLLGLIGGVAILYNFGPQPFDRLAALAIVGVVAVYGVVLVARRRAAGDPPSVDADKQDRDLRSNER